jgi:hypothetical protein
MKFKLLFTSFTLPLLISCASATSHSAQNIISLENTDLKKIKNYKRGEACLSSFFGVTWGGNLLTSAAENAGISKAKFIETEIKSLFFIYNKNCTIIYGE